LLPPPARQVAMRLSASQMNQSGVAGGAPQPGQFVLGRLPVTCLRPRDEVAIRRPDERQPVRPADAARSFAPLAAPVA